ncbi:LacI family DNA-binding transcriptional regulator [Salisediminibacterium halotolerans]|uniref:LacI family DNA-binding transcriptional regulator n=1 Tax=Salisediminibacterium halotolerans TaxID=517425 RepID=UPI000EB3D6F5|nr:LacI family DNA-binding transcriptional regulator [Salisediminibacterium halotolerans]RLJ75768.1 LacI family transcriptional regulator [Actinophytocola xinjiangensis]RPE89622.1 LacI family transcriptional regulator [Salisediminibacterium halotolerans]TWG36381.1 LacI family transcriptional regulator [Salisediminibacterium halotolerans]GEL07542.1 transcriptional regulator EbgR [Salisediminibacterium halotolerans]
MATIRDIAKNAGYSIATVSRVLNQDDTLSVSDAAREKIFKIAAEMNYQTPKSRSTKKKTASLTFGMVYFNSEKQEVNDPYFLAIRLGIEKFCAENNIQLEKVYRNHETLRLNKLQKADGLIVVGRIRPEEVDELVLLTENIIFVDYSPLDSMFDSVVIDFQEAVHRTLDHLMAFNHRRIGYIGGDQFIRPGKNVMDFREIAFRTYLSQHAGYSENDIHIGKFSTEEGYRLMQKALMKSPLPTAFVVASDSMAIGALRALHEQNYRVPQDVSIVGFNDIAASRYLQPSLTTVKVHTEFMGETAVEILMERIRSSRTIPRKTVIPTELIVRESTSYPPE